jgi:hypothetical protein
VNQKEYLKNTIDNGEEANIIHNKIKNNFSSGNQFE